METTAILDGLRMQFPDCRHLAYADLKARMILATSTETVMPQERWEALCTSVVEMLTGEFAQGAGPLTADGLYHAVWADPEVVRLFVRSSANPDDALCCICAPTIALNELIIRAQSCLNEIDQDG